jgi:hypothetical protein
VEEAESKENTFNFGIFVFNFFFRVEGPGLLHVGLETSRWLVREFDGTIEQSDRNTVGRFRGQEESEIGRPSTLATIEIKNLFKFDEPSRHEMNIFKHDPVAFFVSFLDFFFSYFVLALSQSEREETFTSFNSLSFGYFFYLLNGISPWGQNEEYRVSAFSILNSRLQDIRE